MVLVDLPPHILARIALRNLDAIPRLAMTCKWAHAALLSDPTCGPYLKHRGKIPVECIAKSPRMIRRYRDTISPYELIQSVASSQPFNIIRIVLAGHGRRMMPLTAFQHAAIFGRTATAAKIADEYEITPKEVRNGIVQVHCAIEGHLETLQWLVARFGLTIEDMRVGDDCALSHSAGQGHPAIIEWIVEHFQLDETDARSVYKKALLGVATFGSLKTV